MASEIRRAHETTESYDPFIIPYDIDCVRLFMVNICFVGSPTDPDNWVLVDAGLPLSANMIVQAAENRFGPDCKPRAIVLTHGHFDHIGALEELVKRWDVPVYAHEDELPYLTGKKQYLPPDPSVGGGLMSWLSPLYPRDGIDLGERVMALPKDGSIPNMPEWRWIHTPGHTLGHVSFFRERDRSLIVGDAFLTVKQESALAVMTQQKAIHGPPMYFTTDWERAEESVNRLVELEPAVAYTGHGQIMYGEELRRELKRLADEFENLAVPDHGKYVH
ncbi:MBL fold metallo-hydrolase [Brevibacillus dissolubilis]|uniref:MBL fold metallo-hydrolase n=1 Tax=Brevibacillus dissolubilis TaxID=1844116 RepID=UPI00111697A1|nr:MBL fold metallo-hydrolase [Brevibacillus dissolubilis]